MKTKKYRDLFISCFLIVSLGIGAFIVSCSEEDGFITSPGNTGVGDPNLSDEASSEAITSLFASLGDGAASTVGSDLVGWTFSAMGIAGSSGPNYSQQFALIESDLDSIVSLLGDVDDELATINQSINVLTCGTQQSSIQNYIGDIKQYYDNYTDILEPIQNGDTVNSTVLGFMNDWADQILAKGSYTSNTSVEDMLGAIQTNLGQLSGALVTCANTISKPYEGSFGQDTNYYNSVDKISNFYYYYQTIALFLISEASHYYAWLEAGSPGGNFVSSDSVQAVCESNSGAQIYCDEVMTQTNQAYNNLLVQKTLTGAQYTDDYKVLQYYSAKPLIWAAWLEDFTEQSGYNCTSPLTNDNPCGPTAGYFDTKINMYTYRGAQGFHFAKSYDLATLVNGDSVHAYGHNINVYLNHHGFRNMSNKTIIASDSVIVNLDYSNHETTFIPFFVANAPAVLSKKESKYIALFYTENDFKSLLYPSTHVTNNTCVAGQNWYYTTEYKFYNPYNDVIAGDSFSVAYAFSEFCNNPEKSMLISFQFTDHDWHANNSFPGNSAWWPKYFLNAQQQRTAPKRFLLPLLYALNAGCTNGRAQVNANGMVTQCGDDFTGYLNTNVPKPPTCENKNTFPQCTNLE